MRLDFNILWVEDQPDEIKHSIRAVEAGLKEMGFLLNVIPAKGFNEVQKLMKDGLEDDAVDLILVDFDLGYSGGNGGDAAKEIRERFQHREMAFYSGKSPGDLRQIAAKNKIDGVYFVPRTGIEDDLIPIIENILRKVLDISHMRGIVMAETSELDYYIGMGLVSAFENLDTVQKEKICNKSIETIRKRYAEQTEKLDALCSISDYSALLGESLLMTARDKSRSLIRLIKAANDLENKNKHKKAIVDYQDNFQNIRNILAHGMVVKENGQRVFKGHDKVINEDAMLQWRLDLIRHKEQIIQAAKALGLNEKLE